MTQTNKATSESANTNSARLTIEIPAAKKEIRTGQPIIVLIKGPLETPTLIVENENASTSLRPFSVPLTALNEGSWQGEFSVAIPGTYILRARNTQAKVQVVEQHFMPFKKEFGIFSFVTVLLVGGMILWLKKRKKF